MTFTEIVSGVRTITRKRDEFNKFLFYFNIIDFPKMILLFLEAFQKCVKRE